MLALYPEIEAILDPLIYCDRSQPDNAIPSRKDLAVEQRVLFKDLKMRDAHTEHCCIKHGCKYRQDAACPVVQKIAPQAGPCEDCGLEMEWD